MRIIIAAIAAALAALIGPAVTQASGPDERIAFARLLPAGGASIHTVAPDGSDERLVPLVDPAEDFGIPFWSPDRTRILISHVMPLGEPTMPPATVDPDGSGYTLLDPPDAPFNGGCFGGWFPDARRLLCSLAGDPQGVVSIDAATGGDRRRLTSYPYDSVNCNACDMAADVSPDGRRFVFVRFRHENSRARQEVALFVGSVDGGTPRRITPWGYALPHELASARWSPNGSTIASATAGGRLFLVRPDGSGLRKLDLDVDSKDVFAFEPDWSPDGSRLVFAMFRDGQEDLYAADPDGSNVSQITDTPDFENGPDWGTR